MLERTRLDNRDVMLTFSIIIYSTAIDQEHERTFLLAETNAMVHEVFLVPACNLGSGLEKHVQLGSNSKGNSVADRA